MPIPFSPWDLNVGGWWIGREDQVEFWPDPDSARIRRWRSYGNGNTHPLTSWDHGSSEGVSKYRSPLLSTSGVGVLGGVPTLSFPRGAYINAVEVDWYNLSLNSTLNTRDPDATNEFYNEGSLFPCDGHHMFCLLRVDAPLISPTDDLFTGPSGYELNKRRPGIICTGDPWYHDSEGAYPSIHLESWTPGNNSAGGQLKLIASTGYLVNDDGSGWPYKIPYTATVTLPRLGEWMLLEWAVYPPTLTIPSTATNPPSNYANLSVQRVKFWINGREVGPPLYRPAAYPYTYNGEPQGTSDTYSRMTLSLFGELIADGTISDPLTCWAGGNVAELMLFPAPGAPINYPTGLSDDDLAKIRAFILRRWGLVSLLPMNAPYRQGLIPGPSPVSDWGFPGLRPSERTYTPGIHPATPFGSVAGVERQVRHSSFGYVGDRLSLSFKALSEAEKQSILDHYDRLRGGYYAFGLSPDVVINLTDIAAHINRAPTRIELMPKGAAWTYVQEPSVETIAENINNVSVELTLIRQRTIINFLPPEGGGVAVTTTSVDELLAPDVPVTFGGDPQVLISSGDGVSTNAPAAQIMYDVDTSMRLAGGTVSPPAETIGTPTLDTVVKYAGASSLFLNGDAAIPTPELIRYELPVAYGLGDFCVEARIRVDPSVLSNDDYLTPLAIGSLFSLDVDGTTGSWVFFLNYPAPTENIYSPAGSVTPGVFQHVAVYRVAGAFYLAVDGDVSGPETRAFDFTGVTALEFMVGDWTVAGNYAFRGWVDHVRVHIGASPYGASDFTPNP